MPRLELEITEALDGRTVRSLLRGELGLSAGCVGRLKRAEGGITVGGVRVFTNAVLQTGDTLTVDLDAAERPTAVEPVPMELDIAFEDEHLLILNKAAPLAVIPSSFSPGEPTLAGGLAHYLGPGFSFHPVNRLDRGTTGLLAVAKTGCVHEWLQRQLHSGDFFRQYLAVCTGTPVPWEGTIELPIGRAPGSVIARQVDSGGQSALTEYRVLEAGGGFSLVELTPHTGRTHQLRVHMAALGCPLAGDWLYGTEEADLIPRPALHAARLELRHPVTGERLSLEASLPQDMKKILERFICPS